MAIVQISQIIHRTGNNIQLPQLAAGELGYATDTKQLYIGNDPVVDELATEVLTRSDNCAIYFSQVSGDAVADTVTTPTLNIKNSDDTANSYVLTANANGIFFTDTSTGDVFTVNLTPYP